LGDFLPFMALGEMLKKKGFAVRMAVNQAMHKYCRKGGLQVASCGIPFGPKEVRARAEAFDYWHEMPLQRCLRYYRLLKLPHAARDLVAACQGADLLIASTVQGVAHLACEKTGIPWLSVSLVPSEFDRQIEEAEAQPGDDREGRIWNELDNDLRSSIGLPRRKHGAQPERCGPDRMLLACSRHFGRPRLARPGPMRQTGFWFYDGEAAGPRVPSRALRTFVEGDAPPLVLSLSSQPVSDPGRLLAVHVKAAMRLGCRLVVQRGWAGLSKALL